MKSLFSLKNRDKQLNSKIQIQMIKKFQKMFLIQMIIPKKLNKRINKLSSDYSILNEQYQNNIKRKIRKEKFYPGKMKNYKKNYLYYQRNIKIQFLKTSLIVSFQNYI